MRHGRDGSAMLGHPTTGPAERRGTNHRAAQAIQAQSMETVVKHRFMLLAGGSVTNKRSSLTEDAHDRQEETGGNEV